MRTTLSIITQGTGYPERFAPPVVGYGRSQQEIVAETRLAGRGGGLLATVRAKALVDEGGKPWALSATVQGSRVTLQSPTSAPVAKIDAFLAGALTRLDRAARMR